MGTTKTLVLAIGMMALTSSVSAKAICDVKPDPTLTYSEVALCLEQAADLVEDDDFKQEPGSTERKGAVVFRKGLFDDLFVKFRKEQICACATKKK